MTTLDLSTSCIICSIGCKILSQSISLKEPSTLQMNKYDVCRSCLSNYGSVTISYCRVIPPACLNQNATSHNSAGRFWHDHHLLAFFNHILHVCHSRGQIRYRFTLPSSVIDFSNNEQIETKIHCCWPPPSVLKVRDSCKFFWFLWGRYALFHQIHQSFVSIFNQHVF